MEIKANPAVRWTDVLCINSLRTLLDDMERDGIGQYNRLHIAELANAPGSYVVLAVGP